MWKLRVVALAVMVAVGLTVSLAQACDIEGPGVNVIKIVLTSCLRSV